MYTFVHKFKNIKSTFKNLKSQFKNKHHIQIWKDQSKKLKVQIKKDTLHSQILNTISFSYRPISAHIAFYVICSQTSYDFGKDTGFLFTKMNVKIT